MFIMVVVMFIMVVVMFIMVVVPLWKLTYRIYFPIHACMHGHAHAHMHTQTHRQTDRQAHLKLILYDIASSYASVTLTSYQQYEIPSMEYMQNPPFQLFGILSVDVSFYPFFLIPSATFLIGLQS